MMLGIESPGQRRRVIWLAAILAGVCILLAARLVWWQLLPREEMESVDWRGQTRLPIPAVRGSVLDANGHYLVISTIEYDVAVTPRLLSQKQKEMVIPTLAPLLNQDESAVAEALALNDQEYVPLAKDLPAAVGQQIEDLDLPAFNLDTNFRRIYPDGMLAASVLGFIHFNNVGQYGLEQYYEDALRGVDGTTDLWGEQLASLRSYRPARDGVDLVLTLDRNIQYAAERILRDGLEQNKATSGSIIVMDPRTGALLAMASLPTYDPADYASYWAKNPNLFINTAISAVYEPGSVFKPLTLASALEAQVIRPTDTYEDRGEITVGNQKIQNWDKKAHGRQTMTDILAYSRNVGAAHVATLLGQTRFYELIRRFGFSEVTGVDLAMESSGIMRVPGNVYWHLSDLGTNSFGQGISVTPLQIVAAYGALANDGVLMKPYIVGEVREGKQVRVREPIAMRRVISSETAKQITEMMANAVDIGMKQAVPPGYRLAGKTGTSGVPNQEGYKNEDTIASFAGFGPVPNPRFVVLVKFDKPKEGYWGGDVAAPEFREMCKFLFDYYGIPPTRS